MKARKKLIGLLLSMTMLLITGCGGNNGDLSSVRDSRNIKALSESEALAEIDSLYTKISVNEVTNPTVDIYSEESTEKDTLADIDTFPIVLYGNGDIDIEIAAPSELCGDAPDDWLIQVAEKFNKQNNTIDGKTVSVSIRKISSGEVVTYVDNDAYRPDVYIPSNYTLGMMLESSGVGITKIEDRIAGNTAGILMKKDVYDTINKDYGEVNVANVLTAANDGKIIFAYTNPYTSATGLNVLVSMLKAFDENDPLSSKASEALLEYQKNAPPVAYTTGVLRNSAKKGVVSAMVMEEQAYVNTPELKDYVYNQDLDVKI